MVHRIGARTVSVEEEEDEDSKKIKAMKEQMLVIKKMEESFKEKIFLI